MEFEEKKRIQNNERNYHIENMGIAREFSKELIMEMKELVRSIVIFGSNTQNTLKEDSDIDLMVVLDNVSVYVTPQLREAYRVITTSLCEKLSDKIHLMTVNLSDLWDMARKGDPVLINILRYGVPIFDRDLVEPLQYLLEIGRIKPTREAAYNYMSRSQTLLEETNKHLEEAMLDLYYSVIDITHSTLIVEKIVPPSPKDMPEIFQETFKNKRLEKYSTDIRDFYTLAKDIEYKRVKADGKMYDKYFKKAQKLVLELKTYNDEKLKNTNLFDL